MQHLGVLIYRFDDRQPDALTEVATFTLPSAAVDDLQPETALDTLEATTQTVGHAVLRRLLQAQWEQVDAALTQEYLQRFARGRSLWMDTPP